ncbi:phage tail protein [Paracoccus sp. AK26]|uniref:phage tail protein n=1 Tax=Paracoccus sp. AK26 TaxID=2589076 RepID=UPI0014282E71|nr:phage tail protein [Paracoccus sp. AK26]QIR85002.1 hypothetical protein FIU66_07160 [Paracoccus sp. AK26]
MKKILLLSAAVISAASPAHADPVSAIATWIAVNANIGLATAFAIANAAVGLGASIIGQVLFRPEQQRVQANVKFDVEIGDELPLRFIVGEYVTAGQRKYIGSWGKNTRFITEVIEYSAIPQGLDAVWVNDEKGEFVPGQRAFVYPTRSPETTTGLSEGSSLPGGTIDAGRPLSNMSDDGNRIYVKVVDGTQTAADPYLKFIFGDDEDYPWTDAMVGRGKSYAIITTRYDSDSLTSYPRYLFQPAPLPLYDWRKDSTNGGVGPHRWGNRSKYEATRNPAVIAYNITRGIYYGAEWVFGGKNLAAWRLPVAEWTAAANECDDTVTLAGGGTQPRYRCGMEVAADMEPAGVLEELGKAANMRFAEVGGRLKPIVGLPGSAVLSITDGDILISEGQSFNPFYPVSETFNAISATYPEPGEKWTAKDAPEYIDTDAQAEDGQYLPTSLSYGAVPYARQVQRLMRSQMRDFRRMRRHQFHLPPDAYGLEPGIDLISWTSDRNGYGNKLFMVESVSKTPGMNVAVSLREVNPADYDWSSDFEKPVVITPPKNPRPFVQDAEGFNVAPAVITDQATKARRPDVLATYTGEEAGVTHIHIRARVQGQTAIVVDTERAWNEAQQWRSFNVLPAIAYEFQARLFSKLTPKSGWSAWKAVTTPDVGFSWEDWDADLREQIESDLALIPAAQKAAADALDRADEVRSDHDALVEGFVGKLTDLTAADQGIQQRMNLLELSVSNTSYIRKTDGADSSLGGWTPLTGAPAPITGTAVPSGQTGRSITISAPGAYELPAYTGADLEGSTFRIRGWVWVSTGATARMAFVSDTQAVLAQSAPITGGWQQIDLKFEVSVATGDWAPAWLVTTGGTMRFFRVRLEDYSAAADLEASISLNAQAIVDETAARAAQIGTLTARANSLAGRIFPSDMRNQAEFWTQNTSGNPETTTGLHSSVSYLTETGVGDFVRIPTGNTDTIRIMSKAVTEYTPGKTIRITVKMRTNGSTPGSLRANFASVRADWTASRGLGATLLTPTAGNQWQTLSVDYTLPAALSDEVWLRVGVYSNPADLPDRSTDVAFVRIDDITAAKGLTGELSGEITSIKGLDVDALAGTAFGVLLEQLEVGADGTSAAIRTQGSALVDLKGNASAGYLIEAKAGGQVALIDLIAADGSGKRPTSIIKLDAREVIAPGTLYAGAVAVVGLPTMVPDPTYKDLDNSWVATSGILGTTTATTSGIGVSGWGGEHILTLGANNQQYARTLTRKVAVPPGKRVKLEVTARSLTNGREAGARLFFYETEGQAAGSPTATAQTDWVKTTATKLTREFDVPSGCSWMALELANRRVTTGDNGGAWFGYPELRVMDAANLVVAGGAVADWFSSTEVRAMLGRFSSLQAANLTVGVGEITRANIRELAVDRIRIAGEAVTSFPNFYRASAFRVSSTSSWTNVGTLSFVKGRGGPMPVYFRADVAAGTFTDLAGKIRLLRDGVQARMYSLYRQAPGEEVAGPNEFTFIDVDTGPGPVTFRLQVMRNPVASGEFIDLTHCFIGAFNAHK